ncbi:hypothetical protein [Comamonas sp. lk]|uniref:hypothetical protein n=1 Tax=Comamonas sp. lk TaxID=2201272 RepID=UPI0013CE3E2B|nr:hypothetical protein [Comamonas sp. lk]
MQESKKRRADQNKPVIKITLDVREDNEKSNLTLAEIGALSTAANRAINEIAATQLEQSTSGRYVYAPQSDEPALVQVEVTSIRKGSLILQGVAQTGIFLSTNSDAIMASIAAALAYDGAKGGVKVLAKHVKRAADRLKAGSSRIEPTQTRRRVEPTLNQSNSAVDSAVKRNRVRAITVKIEVGEIEVSSESTISSSRD